MRVVVPIIPQTLLLLFILGTSACSSNPSRSPADKGKGAGDTGAGGNSGNSSDAVSGGHAGTSDDVEKGLGGETSVPSASGLVDACFAYQLAQCQRISECNNTYNNCLFNTLDCPDVLFSPGTKWTVALAKDCAKQFATLPCEAATQWARSPICAPPGTRAAEETCISDFQCQSQDCVGTGRSCGKCAATTKNGDNCYGNTSCPVGSYCEKSLKCVPFPAVSTEPVLPATDAGTAVVLPTLGMSCTDTLACAGASYCDGKTCVALPGKNALCGVNAQTGKTQWCAEGLFCNGIKDICQPPPVAGEDCMIGPDPNTTVQWICASDLFCSHVPATPECRSYGDIVCTRDSECGDQRLCACPDGGSNCRSKRCIDFHLAGEACDAETVHCHPAFACVNGICNPRESQDLFTELCRE